MFTSLSYPILPCPLNPSAQAIPSIGTVCNLHWHCVPCVQSNLLHASHNGDTAEALEFGLGLFSTDLFHPFTLSSGEGKAVARGSSWGRQGGLLLSSWSQALQGCVPYHIKSKEFFIFNPPGCHNETLASRLALEQ